MAIKGFKGSTVGRYIQFKTLIFGVKNAKEKRLKHPYVLPGRPGERQ
jgi:hypothetical protein